MSASLKTAFARSRKGGRHRTVKADDIRAVAKLGASVSALYRHAPGLRGRVGEPR